jgi:hypothetical protein
MPVSNKLPLGSYMAHTFLRKKEERVEQRPQPRSQPTRRLLWAGVIAATMLRHHRLRHLHHRRR